MSRTRTVLLVVALGLATWLMREGLTSASLGHKRSDLLPTYVAAHLLTEAGPDRVYHSLGFLEPEHAPADWVATQRRFVGDEWHHSAFLYHPLYLELVAPVARALPLSTFEQLVYVLNALASAVVGWMVAGLGGLRETRPRALATLLVGLAVPLNQAAVLGQNTVILAALALLGLRGVMAGRAPSWGEGAALVTCAVLKPWSVLLLGVPLLAGHLAAAGALAVAWLAIAEVLPRLLLPAALIAGWDRVRPMMEGASLRKHNNASLRVWLDRLGRTPADTSADTAFPWVPNGVWWAEKAVALGVAAVAVALVVRRRPHPTDLVVGALALVLVPLGTLWTHYLTLALPAAAVLAGTRTGWARALGVGALVVLVTAPQHTVFAALAARVPATAAAQSAWRVAGEGPGWATVAFAPWVLVLAVGLAVLATARPAPATA